MAMHEADLQAMIAAAFPGAEVTITDLAGDGDHYAAHIVSESFRGLSRVAQHKAVYAALGGRMGGELHALQLTTAIPSSEPLIIVGATCATPRRPMSDPAVHDRISKLVADHPPLLFMEGPPLEPDTARG